MGRIRSVRRLILWGMLGLLGLAGLVSFAFALSRGGAGQIPEPPVLEVIATAEPATFARAREPRQLQFPQDHGPHFDYQTEWWYYVGNLHTSAGRHFGFQLTFFRRGLRPGEDTRPSSFAANHIYSAHLAITDTEMGEHRAWERFARGALGLAGAQAEPYQVWLDDWSVQALDAQGTQVRLYAVEQDVALELILRAEKPPVAHGEGGLSQKGPEVGNASFYVSFTRMSTNGQLSLRGVTYTVQGGAWFDHEWGTAALGPEAVGWDWFGLQLEDGRDLMLVQIRREDGSLEVTSGGTLVEPDGESLHLPSSQVLLEPLGRWTSPQSGATYPVGWQLRVPQAEIELELRPRLEDQENRLSVVYWEGSVAVTGMSRGRAVTGAGYAELTGYSQPLRGDF